MHNKSLNTLIIVSLIATNLFACKSDFQTKKAISTDTPYYSVTIGSYEKSSNTYMNLDIEMPKITYSNNISSTLIDPLNAEIENSLNTLIEESKKKALSTYESYIESAKSNAKKDVENHINNLKEKYKNVIGDEEVKLISDFTVDDLERRPFDRRLIATESNTEATVKGFTNSNDIINPALHNKNIIVVETTEKEITETTIDVKGKPGKVEESEGGNRDFREFSGEDFGKFSGDGAGFKKRGTRSNADRMPNEFKKNNTKEEFKEETKKQDANNVKKPQETTGNEKLERKIATGSETKLDFSRNKKEDFGLLKDHVNESDIDEEITLDNFYKEFRRIYMTRIPDDYTLAMYYIPTTIKCNFEVKCLDEDYLSLFVEISESRTTTMIKRLFYNVDLNKGKILKIKDFLGEKYKENTITIINSEIEKWSDEQKANLIKDYSVEKYINDDTPFFINNNHRAVVQIEKFAITIGASGYHEFQIP